MTSTSIRPVILAGGGGTRLWPLSREHFPKQFIALTDDKYSLLQQTLIRLQHQESDDRLAIEAPILVCNEEHRFLVAEQARQIACEPLQILLEPVGRNTAPALTCAALLTLGKDPVLLVTPADHTVKNTAAFHSAITLGSTHALQNALVTFGIVPDRPETGFGYIRCGAKLNKTDRACAIDKFVEKPSLVKAQEYLDSKEYLWNSGMFMVKSSVWLKAIERYHPDILAACRTALSSGSRDNDFFRLNRDAFEACPSESIDYAVMEKLDSASGLVSAVLPLDAAWSDVGSWSGLWQIQEHDTAGNVMRGDVCALDSTNNVLVSESRFVAILGCTDLVVVETADAVLIVPKDRAQDVKLIGEWLKSRGRDERVVHRKVYRPWGNYEGIDVGERFQVKRIQVKPGGKLSLQMHHHRAEHWIVVRGTAQVFRGEEEFLLTENQSTYIPLGVKHRLINPGAIPLELIEVQSGPYLGEDDIVRFEDIYNRA